MSTTEPYSPIARAKARPGAADDRPAPGSGSTTRRKVVEVRGAQRCRGLLDLAVELDEHRLHRADDERERDEGQGDDEAPASGVEVQPDRAVRAVEREQHDARDDRRQRERAGR